MDENAKEFLKDVVETDIQREIIDALAMDELTADEKLIKVLNGMGGSHD